MNRDFKGVWIPKEIWLSTELTMLEKVILTEINSLDNEEHCTAGNEYFAEFCQCSTSAVTKAIKHLKELGLIEELNFDGRHRKIRVVNFTKQTSKFYEAESENLLSNNIANKQNNNKNNSKELLQNFEFGKQKPVKQSLYTKCVSLIHDKTNDEQIQTLLITWLNMLLEKYKDRGKPLYANVFKGKLNMLDKYDKEDWQEIIEYNLQRGYEGFYPVRNNQDVDVRKQPWNEGVISRRYTEEELAENERKTKERIAQGKRVIF